MGIIEQWWVGKGGRKGNSTFEKDESLRVLPCSAVREAADDVTWNELSDLLLDPIEGDSAPSTKANK